MIGLENLNVRGMMANHKLAGSIADAAFYETRRQITYKARWYGGQVVIYPQFEPMAPQHPLEGVFRATCSKKLNCCGVILSDLKLPDRMITCPKCGKIVDRDYNVEHPLLGGGLEHTRLRGELCREVKRTWRSWHTPAAGCPWRHSVESRETSFGEASTKHQVGPSPICLSFG